MITLHDLNEAIAECQGERNPDAKTCQKLAAFYIIKERMYPEATEEQAVVYSSGGNISIGNNYSNDFNYESDTEFAKIAGASDKNLLMQTMDELMTVLEATNPRLYRGVLRKLTEN